MHDENKDNKGDVIVLKEITSFTKLDHQLVESFPQDNGWSWVCVVG